MKGPNPPRLAAWLVDRVLPSEKARRLLGDLDVAGTPRGSFLRLLGMAIAGRIDRSQDL